MNTVLHMFYLSIVFLGTKNVYRERLFDDIEVSIALKFKCYAALVKQQLFKVPYSTIVHLMQLVTTDVNYVSHFRATPRVGYLDYQCNLAQRTQFNKNM